MFTHNFFYSFLATTLLLSASDAVSAKGACPLKKSGKETPKPAAAPKKTEAKPAVSKKEMAAATPAAAPAAAPAMSTGGVQHVTALADLEAKIASGFAVVKFSAEWCGPCKKFKPVFEEVVKEFNNVTFIAVDVDQAQAISDKFGIRGIPTVKYFKDGKEIKSAGGASKKDFVNTIKSTFGI